MRKPVRYAIKQDLDQTWGIYDIFTGTPYGIDMTPAVGMPKEAAQKLTNLLNQAYKWRLDLKD